MRNMKKKDFKNIPYNTLSDEGRTYELARLLDFDLQMFGKGSGKSGGKIALTLVGALFGGFGAGFGLFGAGVTAVQGALMGAALTSTIWTATHKPKMNDEGSPSVQRFDKTQETMSNAGSIPVVYGERKIAGNQTFHETNPECTELHKHVVLCEGNIEGITSVTAAGLLIPTGTQSKNTVFTIQNNMYENATVGLYDKLLTLDNGNPDHPRVIHIELKNKDDLNDEDNKDENYWEYQVSIDALVSYINQLNGDGWECFPVANTNKMPGDLIIEADGHGQPCYRTPINFSCDVVTGGTSYTFHDCEAPGEHEQTGGYAGCAWLDMRFFNNSNLNGNPNVEVVVKGRKIYIPWTGETLYTTNPAICTLDFLTNRKYGLGRWITYDDLDIDSFREAAEYCSQEIDFEDSLGNVVRQRRYELNMVIDQRQDSIKWLQAILASFSGYLVFSQGKGKLMVERETPIYQRFNDKTIKDLTISQLPLSDTPNEYEVSIIDPRNNWKAVKCKVSDYADQKLRGKIITKEVDLDGVTSQFQALRLARFYRDYNLVCSLQVTFTTGMMAMNLEPGDVVTLTYRNAFTDLPIRISEIRETNEHTYEISGRQYNETLYSDVLGGGVTWFTYGNRDGSTGLSDFKPVPDKITNVVAWTNTDDEILIEHDPSYDPYFAEYRYYIEPVEG